MNATPSRSAALLPMPFAPEDHGLLGNELNEMERQRGQWGRGRNVFRGKRKEMDMYNITFYICIYMIRSCIP
jgi:hypothetical protein